MKLRKIGYQEAEKRPVFIEPGIHEFGRSKGVVQCPFCDFGELVCPGFDLVAGQTLCDVYASTFNIGFIIKRMAQLLGLYEDDPRDFGEAIAWQPVRIYSWGVCGGNYMDSICIGHFMDDRWLWGRDLMRTGLPKKGGAE